MKSKDGRLDEISTGRVGCEKKSILFIIKQKSSYIRMRVMEIGVERFLFHNQASLIWARKTFIFSRLPFSSASKKF